MFFFLTRIYGRFPIFLMKQIYKMTKSLVICWHQKQVSVCIRSLICVLLSAAESFTYDANWLRGRSSLQAVLIHFVLHLLCYITLPGSEVLFSLNFFRFSNAFILFITLNWCFLPSHRINLAGKTIICSFVFNGKAAVISIILKKKTLSTYFNHCHTPDKFNRWQIDYIFLIFPWK